MIDNNNNNNNNNNTLICDTSKTMTNENANSDDKHDLVRIYCDGACSGNPGIGGWGALLIWGQKQQAIYGYEQYTTNNRMEILAAIEAIKAIKRPIPLQIYTDSTYLKNGISEWIIKWKANGWNKGKIKNIDLWQNLDALCSGKNITWHWVRGHSGDPYNEEADRLANLGISAARQAGQK